MIGQAGTGSPEAGIVLRVDPRVLVYTCERGRDKTSRSPGRTGESRLQYSTVLYLFCVVEHQVTLRWQSDTRPIYDHRSQRRCVKLFGDFGGSSARLIPSQAEHKWS